MHKRVSQKLEPLDRTENTFITKTKMVCLITPSKTDVQWILQNKSKQRERNWHKIFFIVSVTSLRLYWEVNIKQYYRSWNGQERSSGINSWRAGIIAERLKQMIWTLQTGQQIIADGTRFVYLLYNVMNSV